MLPLPSASCHEKQSPLNAIQNTQEQVLRQNPRAEASTAAYLWRALCNRRKKIWKLTWLLKQIALTSLTASASSCGSVDCNAQAKIRMLNRTEPGAKVVNNNLLIRVYTVLLLFLVRCINEVQLASMYPKTCAVEPGRETITPVSKLPALCLVRSARQQALCTSSVLVYSTAYCSRSHPLSRSRK